MPARRDVFFHFLAGGNVITEVLAASLHRDISREIGMTICGQVTFAIPLASGVYRLLSFFAAGQSDRKGRSRRPGPGAGQRRGSVRPESAP